MTAAPTGLAKKSIGTSSMFWFCVAASAPMTVLAGGVVATYATSGMVSVPISFIVLAVVLGLFTVGYLAMSRHVQHAATFYAYLARGAGRVSGVMGGAVALLAYNCIQISLYGLIGFSLSGILGGQWWVWALAVWAVIAVLGVLHVGINAIVLAVVLVCEIVVIALFDVASFLHPAGGTISTAPMMPGNLVGDGVGSLFALGVAAFVGYELGPVFGEEARSHRTVTRATFGAVIFLGVFYAVSSWAMATAVGPDAIVAAAQDPNSGLPFAVIEQHYGKALSLVSQLLLMTSIFAALLSFHNGIGRYVFGLSRDGVLPAAFSRVGRGGSRAGAPIGGSLVQSAIALVVVIAFALAGADPFTALFTWLSTVAAIGIMVLMFATSFAVVGFFRKGGGAQENVWQRVIAPALGGAGLLAVLIATVANVNVVTGTGTGSTVSFVLPGLVLLAAMIGLVWALALRSTPHVYNRIGTGEPEPLAILEHDLSDLRV